MSKIVLDNVASGYNLNKINANFDKIEAALNDQVLYRDVPEGETNTVKNTIDMDSNDILNVGDLRVLGVTTIGGKNIDALNSALVWRGTWNSGTAYAESDAVHYLGTSYIAIAPNTNEIPPSANWDILAAQGAPGAGTGDVNGPASAIDNNLVSFNAGTGKVIKDSGFSASSFVKPVDAQKAEYSIASVGGTADVLTLTFTPALTVLNGGIFQFVATSDNATTTPTGNPDGLGAKTFIKGNNLPLVAGDIKSGMTMLARYDSVLGKLVLLNPATGVIASAVTVASTAEAQAGTDNTKVITPLRMREGFNAAGSAPVYACRAWVNFNGTGTVAIRSSGNVSSISDNATGDYTVNFSTALTDTNYTFSFGVDAGSTGTQAGVCESSATARTTSLFRIYTGVVSTNTDFSKVMLSVHR